MQFSQKAIATFILAAVAVNAQDNNDVPNISIPDLASLTQDLASLSIPSDFSIPTDLASLSIPSVINGQSISLPDGLQTRLSSLESIYATACATITVGGGTQTIGAGCGGNGGGNQAAGGASGPTSTGGAPMVRETPLMAFGGMAAAGIAALAFGL